MTLHGEIARNRWNTCVCIESMTLLGKKGWTFIESAAFLFSFNWCFICGRGLQSRPVSAPIDADTQNECLFNGLGASRVMISLENGPPQAKATLTAAEPQVGQRGTTELGRNSCPPDPLGSVVNQLNGWLRCVRCTTGPFDTSAVAPTWDPLPPAALPLTTSLSPGWTALTLARSMSLSGLYIHQEHFIHMIHWALQQYSNTMLLH